MLYNMFHGKIHRATVTQANLEYMGSITIDEELLELAGILPGERVQVVNNNNGARLETYTIAGKRGSGVICLNGAAARKAQVGDTVIIIAYAMMTKEEAQNLVPDVVMVDEHNRLVRVRGTELEGEIG
ncbi:aspartate 1-decarboxylase [Megamonas funiformis]|uniref:aspartate 1-decarboxylase n=1 Tax=Megamonas funiformis TaxID=437897 RepID=UPI00388DF88C